MVTTRSEGKRAESGANHQIKHESAGPLATAKQSRQLSEQPIKDELDTSSEVKIEHTEGEDGKTIDAVKSTRKTEIPLPGPRRSQNDPYRIQEKGVIYFFVRGRVETKEPRSMDDVARTFIILHPTSQDTKLTSGPMTDTRTRLFIVPKKSLPKRPGERLIAFVEEADIPLEKLRETFLSKEEYQTKTMGVRHVPPAIPIAEGVYALTSTGKESHLAYIVTVTGEEHALLNGVGVRDRGSLIIATKNPKVAGPANYQLPEVPQFPEEIQDQFGKYRWIATRPQHMDYRNAQFLLIGERPGLERATGPREQDTHAGGETPIEVLEELEDEDSKRMRQLDEDESAALFKDLHSFSEDMGKMSSESG